MNIYDFTDSEKISIRRILDFTSLVNPLGPSGKAKAAIRKAVKTVQLHPDEKLRFLRRHIAKIEGIGEKNILFVNGSSRVLTLLIGRPHIRSVASPAPFPPVLSHLSEEYALGAIAVPTHSEEGFVPDAESLIAVGSRVQVLVIPNPHTVTGAVLSSSLLESLIQTFKGPVPLIVIDESLSGFAGNESPVRQVVEGGNSLIVRSFSLFHGLAGLRLGYVIGREDLLRKIGGDMEPWPINTFAAPAALASLKDRGYQKRTLDFIKEEKIYLKGKLAKLDALSVTDTPCNFLLLRLATNLSEIASLFLKRNLLVNRFTDEAGREWLQVPVRRHKENALFLRALGWIVRRQAGQ